MSNYYTKKQKPQNQNFMDDKEILELKYKYEMLAKEIEHIKEKIADLKKQLEADGKNSDLMEKFLPILMQKMQ